MLRWIVAAFWVGRALRAFANEPSAPLPGACAELQPGVKVCATVARQGSFDVTTSPPAAVYVTFEDTIKTVLPPDPAFYRVAFRDNAVTIVPLKKDLPARATTVIETDGVKVTLHLRPGLLAKADTQVSITDPARGAREAEIERRVSARVAPKEKALADAERRLEDRAAVRADAILLEELLEEGEMHEPGGKSIARNDANIVLRALRVAHVGKRRVVVLSVENLSAEPFAPKGLRLWLKGEGFERELAPKFRFARNAISAGEEARFAIELPPRAKGRLRVLVEESDARRNVELAGMEIR